MRDYTIAYRTAHLAAADGQSEMDAGRISVRVHAGGWETPTAATLRMLRREERTARLSFAGMILRWRSVQDSPSLGAHHWHEMGV